jgi:hypothetical protein
LNTALKQRGSLLIWSDPETGWKAAPSGKRGRISAPCRQRTGAVYLPNDSTGIKAVGEGEWFVNKHGLFNPRQWRKMHPGSDAETLEIRAIGITASRVGHAPLATPAA